MGAQLLSFRGRGWPWIAALLVAALSVVLASPRPVTGAALPDVVLSGLTLTPGFARVGDSVTATITLRNQGSASAAPSVVGLYLGASSGSPLASAVSLGTAAVDALAPGASQQVSRSFTVPDVPSGWFSVIAVADGAASLVENNETNNRRAATLRVTIADLSVSRVTLTPSHARPGDSVRATAVIYNAGQVPANASSMRLNFDTGTGVSPTVIGSGPVGALAAGESRAVSFAFTVPAVTPRRWYYVWAQADPEGSLLETSEGNNRRGAWLEVTIPDLTIASLAVRPSPARAGDPVSAVVVVRNSSPVPANPSTLRVYFEATGSAPSASPSLLGTVSVPTLGPGESRELSLPFTVPPVPHGRSYYVWAQVDPEGSLLETNEGNNRRGAWLQVAIPDLTIAGLALRPSPARAGDPVSAVVVVRNSGPVPANPSTLRVYFEATGSAPSASPSLLGTVPVPTLGPRESREVSLPFTVPPVPPGRSYYVWAQVDPEGNLLETNEDNNRRGAWLQVTIPDLTIAGLAVRPSPARAGDPVSAAVVVRNSGPVPANPSTLRVYFEATGSAPSASPSLLGTVPVPTLGPRESRELSLPFTVPPVPHGRSYYVWAQVDAEGSLLETNEDNNRRGAWLQVAIPDLTIASVAMRPSPARAGDPVTINVRIRNQGPVAASATRAAFYVAMTSNATLDGVAPLTAVDVPRLEPGKEAPLALTVDLPVLSPGQYQLIVVTDANGAQTEGSEANNRRGVAFEVAVPALTVDALTLTPSMVQAGQAVTASVRVSNRGRVSSHPTTTDVFLATSELAEFPGGTYWKTVTIGSLAPGAAVNIPAPITVPVVDPGAYYVIAQIDASTAVGGWTTMLASSAFAAAAPSQPRKSVKLRVSQADLAGEALSLSATRVRPGDSLTVSYTVRNTGTVSAAASEAGVYVAAQSDASLAQATRLATQSVGALAAGASVRLATAVSVPSLPAGAHYIIVAADAGAAIAESSEANNRLAGAFEVLDISDELTVWVVDTLTRVQRTDPPGTARSATIKAARNEYEAFQIVVRAPDGEALSNVNAEASDLVGPAVISRSNITLYRAHYVQVVQASPGSPYPPGWWPDALIPFKHPETGQPLGGRFPAAPFPVAAGQNQPVWVEVYVPTGTPAGTYTGEVTLTAANGHTTVVPVTLTVWNFTLPKNSSVRTAFGQLWYFWNAFGVSPSTGGDIDWRISKTMLQHRVTLNRPGWTLGWFTSDGTALPADAQLQEWLGTLGATTWEIPSDLFANPVGADRAKMIRYLRTMYDYLNARGWSDRAFLYTPTTDEPGSAQDYQAIRDFAAMVHEANPNLRVLVTEQLTPENASWGSLDGSADIWVPRFSDYNASAAQTLQAAGDRVWVYTTGVSPAPVWLLDYPVLNFRVPLWMNWVNRVQGVLYWQSAYWAEVSDPWTDTRTMHSGPYVLNGEGSLVYPGNAVGYNGAIASARLKALRDGLEDYEYLKLLGSAAGTSVADSIARTIATSFTSWSQSSAALQDARQALAERIELAQ